MFHVSLQVQPIDSESSGLCYPTHSPELVPVIREKQSVKTKNRVLDVSCSERNKTPAYDLGQFSLHAAQLVIETSFCWR